MSDMLVKLYNLPEVEPYARKLKEQGTVVRRAMAYEKHQIVQWVQMTFGAGWASESDIAFSNHPISCFIAVEAGKIMGFACYDCTCRDFFGPTGVVAKKRGRGIGRTLLLSSLHAMAANGYAYAIIGSVDSAEFYKKTAGAEEIQGSSPGIYRDGLKKPESN
ncbi:MAG: GNAT family N-acetyltransferase [Deltaproteobacteria bacterium RIFOXYD12_FULL_50_9]|nr:MAG: GNAT family N-acetyltransferase [Deltaproteobacteria bacterium RIFOXYD12_FULL_50_9]